MSAFETELQRCKQVYRNNPSAETERSLRDHVKTRARDVYVVQPNTDARSNAIVWEEHLHTRPSFCLSTLQNVELAKEAAAASQDVPYGTHIMDVDAVSIHLLLRLDEIPMEEPTTTPSEKPATSPTLLQLQERLKHVHQRCILGMAFLENEQLQRYNLEMGFLETQLLQQLQAQHPTIYRLRMGGGSIYYVSKERADSCAAYMKRMYPDAEIVVTRTESSALSRDFLFSMDFE